MGIDLGSRLEERCCEIIRLLWGGGVKPQTCVIGQLLAFRRGGCLGSGTEGVKADLVFFGLIRH